MKKVLVLTDVNFWVNGAGHRVRISALVEYLITISELSIGYLGPIDSNMENSLIKKLGNSFITFAKKKHLSPRGYGKKIENYLDDNKFDIIIIQYIHNSYLLNYIDEGTTTILDVHDIVSERAKEFERFDYKSKVYELPEATEKEIFSIFNYVMGICKPDCYKIAQLAPTSKVLYCPHPMLIVKHKIRHQVKNISFIASEYLPNLDAIEFFIKEVWPQVSAKYPEVKLSIYGNICRMLSEYGSESIELNGFVNNLHDAYTVSDIIINPVRFGAGLKIKNIEALAHGIPLITSPHGSRGLEQGIGKAFLVAADAEEMEKAISLLIENTKKRQGLMKYSQYYVKRFFSPTVCFKPLERLIT